MFHGVLPPRLAPLARGQNDGQFFMKECKYCGMPLEEGDEQGMCDYCRNDDGREKLNSEADNDEKEAEEI